MPALSNELEDANVFSMARVVDPALDRDQRVDVDPGCRDAPVAPLDSIGPDIVEHEARFPQEVDPVGGYTELQDLVSAIGVEELRTTEVGQGAICPRHVVGVRPTHRSMSFVYRGLAW